MPERAVAMSSLDSTLKHSAGAPVGRRNPRTNHRRHRPVPVAAPWKVPKPSHKPPSAS